MLRVFFWYVKKKGHGKVWTLSMHIVLFFLANIEASQIKNVNGDKTVIRREIVPMWLLGNKLSKKEKENKKTAHIRIVCSPPPLATLYWERREWKSSFDKNVPNKHVKWGWQGGGGRGNNTQFCVLPERRFLSYSGCCRESCFRLLERIELV